MPAARGARDYVETLRVPLRWWAFTTMLWASMLLAMLAALPPAVALSLAAALAGLLVLALVGYGGARVSLVDGVFSAGRARIPVTFLREPEPLDAQATRRVAGVEADARAYLLLRPYVATSVRVLLTDPADPTPYWLVSTRHPGLLADELSAAIAAAG
ncbi:MAG: FIG01105974: Probable conserved alanine rich transmembrane protein [uncultured Nocardioidaceae bacterium]|uniref:FIG01105974: Probable conserved alanine rich transmembrane protein n=1 Tax=uncultured Nocardioidaceae bacterium TaxID=253824 RepID=A0A6J4M3H0_9ACTN|nr:MAG: FIG01105974: Probable conserved alanine rich transmembrane protein [uncultured Nocardioidaceae bacterium]